MSRVLLGGQSLSVISNLPLFRLPLFLKGCPSPSLHFLALNILLFFQLRPAVPVVQLDESVNILFPAVTVQTAASIPDSCAHCHLSVRPPDFMSLATCT